MVIDGRTSLGKNNEVYSFACLGKRSQDLKYDGSDTYVEIGDNNVFREYMTVNAATKGGTATRIGNDCHFLSYTHVAHDCILGNHVILSSNAMISGHVEIGDNAIISGYSGVVQFVRIGEGAFIGGFSKLAKDVPPFYIAEGSPAEIRAVNKIGMERRGFDAATILAVQDSLKIIIRSGLTVEKALADLGEKYPGNELVKTIIDFTADSKTGLARPKKKD